MTEEKAGVVVDGKVHAPEVRDNKIEVPVEKMGDELCMTIGVGSGEHPALGPFEITMGIPAGPLIVEFPKQRSESGKMALRYAVPLGELIGGVVISALGDLAADQRAREEQADAAEPTEEGEPGAEE